MANASPSRLAGKRILITRAAAQSEALARELASRGAHAILRPLIRIAPPEDFAPFDAALLNLHRFDWLFLTSQNAVSAIADRAAALKISLPLATQGLQIAAVGPATAGAAEESCLTVAYIAQKHQGTALADELAAQLPGKHVFLPRSDRANPDLPNRLRQIGAQATDVVAYRTLPETENTGAVPSSNQNPDAILFFSPSAVRAFAEQSQTAAFLSEPAQIQPQPLVLAIGPATAAALRACGCQTVLQSPAATIESVLETLELSFAQQNAFPTGESVS